MSERPYSRHYHDLIDDLKFADVYPDDHHYACWSRLLMIADQAWPASAHIPITARKASVQKLAAVGLIDLLPDGRFRMHGLQAERERRSSSAAHAATVRWGNATRSADGNADRIAGAEHARMPRQEETRQEETSRANAGQREGLHHVTELVLDAWASATGRTLLSSGAFAMDYLDDACRRHPEQDVVNAIGWARNTFVRIPTAQQLTVALRGRLDPLPDAKETKAAESEQRERDAGRRRVQATKKRIHDMGAHADEADPACDLCQKGAA